MQISSRLSWRRLHAFRGGRNSAQSSHYREPYITQPHDPVRESESWIDNHQLIRSFAVPSCVNNWAWITWESLFDPGSVVQWFVRSVARFVKHQWQLNWVRLPWCCMIDNTGERESLATTTGTLLFLENTSFVAAARKKILQQLLSPLLLSQSNERANNLLYYKLLKRIAAVFRFPEPK